LEICTTTVDLIFGYKQRGQAARESNNVFFPLTYEEEAQRVISVNDREERAALVTQINEFGQCPAQIFHEPHSPRESGSSSDCAPGLLDENFSRGVVVAVRSILKAVKSAESNGSPNQAGDHQGKTLTRGNW